MMTWTKLVTGYVEVFPVQAIQDHKKNRPLPYQKLRFESGSAVHAFLSSKGLDTFNRPFVKLTFGDSEFLVPIGDLEQALKIAKSGDDFAHLSGASQ